MKRSAVAAAGALAGCSASPAQNIVGSYFPAWLICVIAGVVATAVMRQLLVMADLESHLLLPPLTYAGMALGATLLIWLLWVGQ